METVEPRRARTMRKLVQAEVFDLLLVRSLRRVCFSRSLLHSLIIARALISLVLSQDRRHPRNNHTAGPKYLIE
jgi:hypothetical protein